MDNSLYIASKNDDNQLRKLTISDLSSTEIKLNNTENTQSISGALPHQTYRILPTSTDVYYRQLGNKRYELTDHLGNVRATVSDARLATFDNNNISNTAEIKSYNDYYPGGMLMTGRQYNAGSYRFGYNGKEMDNDISGGITGVNYDYGARIYDSRVVRWLACDPLALKYPGSSPYSYVANNPIIFIDPDGRKILPINREALQIIKLGVSPEEAKYIALDGNNYVDLNLLEQGKKTLGIVGDNFESLIQVVRANEVVEVTVSETMKYMKENSTFDEEKYSNTKTIEKPIDDIWIKLGGSKDFTGTVNGQNYSNFVKEQQVYGESNEPQTFGQVGETLYPLEMGKSKTGRYSTNGNIQVHITNKSFLKDQVKTQAHETFGHALFKLLGMPSSSHGTTRIIGNKGSNDELEKKINKVEKEASDNYEKNK